MKSAKICVHDTSSLLLNKKNAGKKRKDVGDETLHRKRCFKDPKRNIVANIEKEGIIVKQPYLIYYEGFDITPKTLQDDSFHNIPRDSLPKVNLLSARPGAYSIMNARLETRRSDTSLRYVHSESTSLDSRSMISMFKPQRSIVDNLRSSVLSWRYVLGDEVLGEEFQSEEIDEREKSRAPSMFRLREDPPSKYIDIKTTFKIKLVESETMFMLEIPSTAEPTESEEGKTISYLNSLYEKTLLAVKAISHTATQTESVFCKTRKLHVPRNSRQNASTFVSVWEMYDTYNAIRSEYLESVSSREVVVGQINLDRSRGSMENGHYCIKFDYQGSTFSNRLLEALMVMERLIVNRLYRENQLSYNGLLAQDPLSLDVIYNYSLVHLWTFYNNDVTEKLTVTSLCWNETNPNILAVGYGKFYYTDRCKGLVCIWNVKNPGQPERYYSFEHPVTFVYFSHIKGQILAVTFYNGLVLLIDIISRSVLVRASNEHYSHYYPVWQARWLSNYNKAQGQVLVTCGKGGNIYRYKKTKFFTSKKIMSTGKVQGKIQGIDQPKQCYARKTLSSRNSSADVLVRHPTDPLIYLVGTSDGCVFFCSVLRRYDHLEVFLAHNGPVYNIQFNPFCDKVFLTCGGDWCIRVWAEGVFVPLVTLESKMAPVQDALWSPLHSTIIVSANGAYVEIWDLQRRTSTPKSSTMIPSGANITVLHFTQNGFNICIGDIEGNVHVMALAEMPFSPSFQEEMLAQTLKNALITRPNVLEKLLRIGRPFVIVKKTFQSRMNSELGQLIFRATTDIP